MKKVLIGIMNCNFEQYIGECIESAISQTYPCEIFVTDDGSTDASREQIMKHPMINKIFHADNSGDELRAMEDLIYLSRSYDYLYLMSGDDALYDYSIETLLDHAEKNNGDWVYGGMDLITANGNPYMTWTYDGFPESVEEAISYMWVKRSLGTTIGSLFSTKFLNGKTPSRFPGTTFSLDSSTAIDWYTNNPNICRVGSQVLKYRVHQASRSFLLKDHRERMQAELVKKMLRVFGKEYLDKCKVPRVLEEI